MATSMTEARQQMAAQVRLAAQRWADESWRDGDNRVFEDGRHVAAAKADFEAALASLAGVEATEGQDAARWRWLRNAVQNGPLTIAMSDSWSLQPWSGDDPDGRVDRAIAAGVAGEAL